MTNDSTEDCGRFPAPQANIYLENLTTEWLILTILGCVSAFIVACIFIEEFVMIVRHLWKWEHRNQAIILQALYPVFAVTSAISLLVPRGEVTSDFVASLYMSLALCTQLGVVIDYHGGFENMKKELADSQKIQLRSFPVCCLCFCLPKLKISIRNLTFLQLLIYQFAVVKPIMYYVLTVLVDNNRDDYVNEPAYSVVIATFMTASALTALWGNIMMFKISFEPLSDLNIKVKFFCIQFAMLSDNVQRSIEDLIMSFGGITCTDQLDATSSMLRWHSLLVTFEMLPLAILSRVSIGRDRPIVKAKLRYINSVASNLGVVDNMKPNGVTGDDKLKSVESSSSIASYL